MTKTTNELKDLLATLEELRRKEAPDVPAILVETIIKYESQFFDERPEAKKRIEQRVDSFVQNVAEDG